MEFWLLIILSGGSTLWNSKFLQAITQQCTCYELCIASKRPADVLMLAALISCLESRCHTNLVSFCSHASANR